MQRRVRPAPACGAARAGGTSVLLTETVLRVYSPRRFVTDVPHLVHSAVIFLKDYFGTAKLLLCVGQYNCSPTTRTPIKTVLCVCAAAWFFGSRLPLAALPTGTGGCLRGTAGPTPAPPSPPAPLRRGKCLRSLEQPPLARTVFGPAFSRGGCWGMRRPRPADGTVPAAARRFLGVILSPVCRSSTRTMALAGTKRCVTGDEQWLSKSTVGTPMAASPADSQAPPRLWHCWGPCKGSSVSPCCSWLEMGCVLSGVGKSLGATLTLLTGNYGLTVLF